MYYYKALYREPGSADLVYARLREQYPDLDIHIQDPVMREENSDLFHSTVFHDTELGGETAFSMLAPFTAPANGSSDAASAQTGITPSPYGPTIAAILPDTDEKKSARPSPRAVVYGLCEEGIKGPLIQNLRRYGADSVMLSKTPV